MRKGRWKEIIRKVTGHRNIFKETYLRSPRKRHMKMTERGEMDVLKRYEIPEDIGRKANEINWKAMFGSLVLAPFLFPVLLHKRISWSSWAYLEIRCEALKSLIFTYQRIFFERVTGKWCKVRSFLSMLIFLSANVAGVYLFLVPLASLTLIQTCQHRYCNSCCRGLGGGPAWFCHAGNWAGYSFIPRKMDAAQPVGISNHLMFFFEQKSTDQTLGNGCHF